MNKKMSYKLQTKIALFLGMATLLTACGGGGGGGGSDNVLLEESSPSSGNGLVAQSSESPVAQVPSNQPADFMSIGNDNTATQARVAFSTADSPREIPESSVVTGLGLASLILLLAQKRSSS